MNKQIVSLFLQAEDVCGDAEEIDASINVTGGSQSKKKLKSEAGRLSLGGNEAEELHRLRRYCDEVLESNKK